MGYYTDNDPLSKQDNDLLSFWDNPDDLNFDQEWFYIERLADRPIDVQVALVVKIATCYLVVLSAFQNPPESYRKSVSANGNFVVDHELIQGKPMSNVVLRLLFERSRFVDEESK